MKRINVPLLLILAVTGLVVAGGLVALNRFQVARNAGSLAVRARAKLAEGKNDEALKLLAKYVGLRPNDAAAFSEFATLVVQRSEQPGATRVDVSRAFNVLETAVRRAPDDDALRMKLAQFDVRIGRFGDAREHLEVLRQRRAASPDPATGDDALTPTAIEVLRARVFAGLGEYTEAARVASELIGFDMEEKSFAASSAPPGETTEAFIILAAILEEKLRDSAGAGHVIDQLVDANEKDPRAWLAAARWHRQHGDVKKSGAAIARAKALAPDDIETMLMEFELALADAAPEKAAAAIDRGLEKHADDSRVHRAKAMLELRRGDPGKAAEALRLGLERLPKEPGLLVSLADVLLQEDAVSEAEAVIRELGEVVGAANPVVGLFEARVLLQQRKWLPAKAKLEQVRPLVAGYDEQTRQVDLYLGQCYERLGQFDEQLEANRRVLSDDPTSLAARVGAASAMVAAGKTDEALGDFEAIAASIPTDKLPAIPQVWSPLLQLRAAAQLKRPSADRDWTLVDSLLELLQESPAVSQPQMVLIRADVLSRKEEREAARELVAEAVKAFPAEPRLRAALAQLTLRDEGVDAARKVIASAPEEVAKTVPILLFDAQLAARSAGDDKLERLAAIEAAASTLDAEDALRLLAGLASIRLAEGNRQEAERLWGIVAARSPDDLQVRTALYELARDAGDLEKTTRIAAEIGRVAGPTSPQARLAQAGEKLLRVRRARQEKAPDDQADSEPSIADRELLVEARNLLIEAENERPGWSQIQQMFAELEGLRGDASAVIDRLQRAVKLGVSNPAVVRQLVALLYASNRLAEAQEALAQVGPDGLQGSERISAEMEVRAGKFDEAIALAERTVSLDSADANDLLWFGQLLGRSQKADRAEEVLERAVSLAPEKPQTWLTLFAHQLNTNRRRQAQRTLDRAADALAEPERSLVVAQGREMMGDFASAERALDEAIAAAPRSLDVARARTSFLLRRGRLGPAQQALEKLIAADGSDAAARATKAWGRRVLAELIAGRGGYRDLQKGLAILRQNAGSDGRLAAEDAAVEIALRAGRPEPASWRRAITLLETLAEEQPLSVAQRLQLADLCEKTGRWQDCRTQLMSLAASPSASPSIFAILIEKLIAHDELSSARIWLQKLRGQQPDAPITLTLEAKLAMAQKDRPAAVAAAKKLMPSFPVPAAQAGQLRTIARVMEDLGFAKASDKVLTEMARQSPEGVIARAEFLGRQKRPAEAFGQLEKSWNSIPLERLLQTGLNITRAQGTAPTAETREVIDRWFTKARRTDPDSVIIQLMQAEWRELEGKGEAMASLYREILARPNLEPTQEAIVANNLAFHLAQPETAAEALELVERAIETLGPQPDLLDTRGVILLAVGKAPEALDDLQEAVLAPSPVKFLHLAMAQAEARQPEAAKRSLDKARGLGLDPAQLSAADRSRLEKLERALTEKVAGT